MLPELPHINFVMANSPYMSNSILVISDSMYKTLLFYSKCTCKQGWGWLRKCDYDYHYPEKFLNNYDYNYIPKLVIMITVAWLHYDYTIPLHSLSQVKCVWWSRAGDLVAIFTYTCNVWLSLTWQLHYTFTSIYTCAL